MADLTTAVLVARVGVRVEVLGDLFLHGRDQHALRALAGQRIQIQGRHIVPDRVSSRGCTSDFVRPSGGAGGSSLPAVLVAALNWQQRSAIHRAWSDSSSKQSVY